MEILAKSFRYQAASWSNPRRIVAKVAPPGRTVPAWNRLHRTLPRLVKHARYYWLLLAYNRQGASEPAAVWRHAAEDLGAACAGWLAPHLANAKSVY